MGRVKRLFTTPCLLSYHAHVLHVVDESYQYLMTHDTQSMEHIAKQTAKVAIGANSDPDELKIPFWLFKKLLETAPLKKLIDTGKCPYCT